MRAKKLLSAITALTMLPTVGALSLPVTASAASSGTVVRLDPSEASPWEFEGWGTSMGWWGNRIGYSDTLAQQAAELFYSEDGLGLDIVRYNVGGGDDPTHNHITRSDSKLPCFAVPEYNEDGTLKTGENGDVVYSYNWDNDHNQINVLKEIKEQNPNVHIEGYTNSPPWFMTISGCSSGGVDATENLDPENYDNFAVFLADVTEHMDTIGLTFDSYSPMNEPNPATKYWGAYSPKQEGNLVAQGEHQSGIITALKSEYTKRGITTLVAGMDETSIDYSISSYNQLTDDAKTALDRIDTHTYGGSNRAGLKATAVAADKPLWMSEVDGGWNGFGLADRIILDMNGMQPGAWVMWDIVDFHKDSAFQAPDGSYTEASAALNPTATLWGVAMANHDTQEIELANKYYAYGQFTRYINPGDTIIASSGSTLAAYNKTTGDIKIVVSNSSSADKPYTFDLSAFTNTGSTVKEIRSNNSTGDAAEHWAEITGEAALTDKKITTTAKAGTVTTYIVSGNGPTNYAIIKGGSSQIGIGSTVTLTVNTNLTGDIKWSVSDDTKADITDNGVLTAKDSGEVTVYAAVGDFTVSRDFTIPLYTLTGTPSWCSASTRPDDNADYLKAADGDLSTYFDGNQNGWIKYDYGTPFKISEIKLAARSGSGMPERTVGGTVQGSNDGITWTDLYKITSAIPSDTYTTISADKLSSSHAYRFYRYINPDNMTNIAEFLIDGVVSSEVPESDPVIKDIAEFTDNFESDNNIFNADNGLLDADGNKVFASELDRFGNVFAPVKAMASAALTSPIELTNKDLFRMTFTMFAGWENNGKDNTFKVKDKDGNEIAALYMTGGGYNFSEIRIGGTNVLGTATIAQSRSNPGTSKAGANGWNASGQPYVNTVGYNKTVEITIDGAGSVSISATGGMEDTIVTGILTAPVSIGSIELTGDYNSAKERVVSYDNLDADIISYSTEFEAPAPTPAPTATPEPTNAPILPDSGELINLSFDNGDLTSSSSYGKASGTPQFVTADDKQCIYLDGTGATAITLTDANGNSLLTAQTNITISFKVKPTTTATSWWFFAAPNANAQTYQQEQYLGAMTNGGTLTVERYNNSGARSTAATGAYTENAWNDVMISVKDGETTVYINGAETSTIASTVNIADMLGTASVAYIGLANWGTGEFASGYLDDFVIKTGAAVNPLGSLDLGDTSAVTENIIIPADDGITWSSSDESIVTAAGIVTRADETKSAYLTATTVSDGITYSKDFIITVVGKAAAADTFTAYAENGSVRFTSSYGAATPYDMYIALHDSSGRLISVKKNEANGSFDGLEDGSYNVSCYIWDNVTSKHTAVTKTVKAAEKQEMGAYLFAHFIGTENSEDCEQIYFSVSDDGTTWKTINGGAPMLRSTIGEKGVRDPYILRGEDGKFFVIATDLSIYNRRDDSNRWGTCQTAGSKSIVIWESNDLVNWSEARLVEVADKNAGCTWAPEAVYDTEKDAYMVFWASKVSDDGYSTQRIYRSYTKDFKVFTEPEIYIDGGNVSNIDTTIVSDKGVYYRFTKNESKSSITMMKAVSLDGPWADVSTYTINGTAGNTVTGYEGPAIYKLNGTDNWCLLLDYYSKSQGYKPFTTTDISKGVFTSAADFSFDATYRHGTVMPITTEEYNELIKAYPFAN